MSESGVSDVNDKSHCFKYSNGVLSYLNEKLYGEREAMITIGSAARTKNGASWRLSRGRRMSYHVGVNMDVAVVA